MIKMKILCKNCTETYSIGGNKEITVSLTKKQYSALVNDLYERAMKKLGREEKKKEERNIASKSW